MENSAASFIVCYAPTMITTNGVWQGDNPLEYSLPLFILQVLLIVMVIRVVGVFIKPLRQPRFVSEVIGGVVLGPSVMGKIPKYLDVIFPTRSVAVLETMGNLGLVYFIFLVGLQVDVAVVKRTGRKAWAMAAAGIVLPFALAVISFFIFRPGISKGTETGALVLFLGVSLSATAFSVLSRILAEMKLLTSELGKIASAVAIINDGCAWILLALAIAVAGGHGSLLPPLAVVFSGFTFMFLLYLTVKPGVAWVLRRTPEGEAVDDAYICFLITAVMVCGLAADAVGIHAVFGSFILGLMIPSGPVGAALIEKLEDFVTGFMMPLFYAVVGLRVDASAVTDVGAAWFLVILILTAGATKVGTTLLVSSFYGIPTREGLSLSILLNTKGLVELVVLYIALDKKVVDGETFAVMVLLSVAVTALVTPLVALAYRPVRQLAPYKRRTIQRSRPDSELRMLACVHSTRNVPSIVSLLEVSHPSKRSPIFVYAVHLVELTGRESAMLVVHEAEHRPGKHSHGNLNRMQAQSEQIIHAFESYEQHAGGVTVQPLTAVSAYTNMHEDICNLAEDKRVALVILPFHKQQTVDGGMEVTNPGIRTVNQCVMAGAPCSVAILVDRGLGGTARISAGQHAAHHIALLFLGGADDREALAYAWRMADHPGISLTVVRFLDGGGGGGGGEAAAPPKLPADMKNDARVVNVITDRERELLLDDEFIEEFRLRNANDESVVYTEKVVCNGEETVAAIRAMDSIHDLYVVGRGQGSSSPLTEGLTDWSECPELGVIGDLLASSDFGATVSVLVVQQYTGGFPAGEDPSSPVSPSQQAHQHLNNHGNNQKGRSQAWGP
ncbi:unnamed protein product [Spirodela intermedia]|uniref:Uncharacterized protein n=1 Tax=Spirodela intermedia TaxID=51605 RepID=A0A7I8KC60_SPIIN|nr:unnamed protein product [Spirodela intermedia]